MNLKVVRLCCLLLVDSVASNEQDLFALSNSQVVALKLLVEEATLTSPEYQFANKEELPTEKILSKASRNLVEVQSFLGNSSRHRCCQTEKKRKPFISQY